MPPTWKGTSAWILAISAAIRCCFVNTFLDSIAFSVFPASVLQLDALLPSTGSSAATVPPLPRYYGGAKTARCPSRRASLLSLGGTTTAPAASLLHVHGCSPVMESTSSSRFVDHPFRVCLLYPTDRAAVPRHISAPAVLPPHCRLRRPQQASFFRGSITRRFAVAVYASPSGRPCRLKTRFSRRLCFTGWNWLPTGRLWRVSEVILLLPQAWPGATIKMRTQRRVSSDVSLSVSRTKIGGSSRMGSNPRDHYK